MSLIRCFGPHATHMRNNRKKMYEILMENMRFTWENIFQLIFSYMRKIAKTHVLIWENSVKLICSYMRKIAKTHVLIWENMVKLICEYTRKFAKNHTLIYAKNRLRIWEKSLKIIRSYAINRLRIYEKSLEFLWIQIHMYLRETKLKPIWSKSSESIFPHMTWTFQSQLPYIYFSNLWA